MRLLATALVVVLAATPAVAQSLAEAARREKERRQRLKAPDTKAYSDQDLKSPQGAAETRPATPASVEAPAGEASEAVGRDAERDEANWRDRAQQLRSMVGQAEGRVKTLESELEGVRIDRAPAGASVLDPQREQTRRAEMGRLQSEIQAANAALEKARKDLADFEEEARRAGIPPGWVRER